MENNKKYRNLTKNFYFRFYHRVDESFFNHILKIKETEQKIITGLRVYGGRYYVLKAYINSRVRVLDTDFANLVRPI